MLKTKKNPRKFLLAIIGIILLIFVAQGLFKLAKLTPFLFELVFHREIDLKTANHNVNILLLGIGEEIMRART